MKRKDSQLTDELIKRTKNNLLENIIQTEMRNSECPLNKKHVPQNLQDSKFIPILMIYIHNESGGSARKIQSAQNLIKKNNYLCDLQFTKNQKYCQSQEYMFTPEVQVFNFGLKRLKYRIIEIESSQSPSIELF